MTKQSLVIAHNAVGSIPAKNSEQAVALAQCLRELEQEMQAQDRGSNVVVVERKQAESPTEVHRNGPGGRRRGIGPETAKTPAEGSATEN